MHSPKVSIVVPNYNHARFLKKRIQSILNQTYQNFELIYLDDASTDHSNEIFAEFSQLNDPRIRSIVNETNSGSPFKQWNKGIRASKSEYVWIAESDDYADARFLERLVEKLDQNHKVGLAYCQSLEVDEHDNVLSNYEWLTQEIDTDRWKHDFTNNGRHECSNYLVFRCTIPNASAVLFRRSVYDKMEGAPEDFRLCGDWLFWFKVLLESDIAFVAEPLNYFRRASVDGARGKAVKGGLFIEEKIKVLQYICQNTEVSENNSLKSLHKLVYHWMDISIANKIPLTRHKNIYRIAKTLDTNIPFILLRDLSTVTIKKVARDLGITQLIKKSITLKQIAQR